MSEDSIDFHVLDEPLAEALTASHWYLGFSGGVDSTALLHMLARWRRANRTAPELTAIHINHGMQAAAGEWQAHCEWVCRMLRVPMIARQVEVQPGSEGGEAAARRARYAVFEELLDDQALLFLGHHLDDQVETFFLRLLRGAGVQGLAGVPAERYLGGGRVLRPLLQVTRTQLEAYATERGLSWVEDPSNADTAMDRNFLRAEVLPLLGQRWPGYRRTVTRAAEHMAVAAATLTELLPAPETVHSAMGDPGLPITALRGKREDTAATLRAWLQSRSLQAPDQSPLEEFLRQLREADDEASPRLHCSAYTLQRYRAAVYLLPGIETPGELEPLSLEPGAVGDVPGVGRLALEPAVGPGIALSPKETVTVTLRRGGERCRPADRSRGTSLKKLLQEADVPPWWRDRVPLVSLDDEMLAVGDLWLCASSRFRERAGPGEILWQITWDRAR